MLELRKTLINATVTAAGFTGFNPLTTGEVTKFSEAFPQAGVDLIEKAKFIQSTVVNAVDNDAGDGEPLTYERVSLSTDILYADRDTIALMVSKIRAGQPFDITAEKINGIMLVITVEENVEAPAVI